MNQNFQQIEFDLIPINNFWNTGAEKEKKMHRIHIYPAKFPAFITTKAIQYAEQKGITVNTIGDVFCGCGTTAYESHRNGKNFWGCDINPIATLIARTKSRIYRNKKVNEYYQKILSYYQNYKAEVSDLNEINPRIKYWFSEKQINDLYNLKQSINLTIPKKSNYKDFFLCAFSNILKPTSKWLTKSIKPQIDPTKIPKDVIIAFKEQVQFMINANIESDLVTKVNIEIKNLNFLNLEINEPLLDLLVTSPPYVTSYEYGDLYQLSTLWLDYSKNYKDFRNGTIGSIYHQIDFENIIKKLNNTAEECVFRLFNVDKRKAKSVAKYFIDMQNVIYKCYNLIKPEGLSVFVIGNTEYKNIKVKNAEHLVECMELVGFKDIEIIRRKISNKILTPYRDAKGKFTTDSNSRKVYNEEFIVIGTK